jgi:hypothetical protein
MARVTYPPEVREQALQWLVLGETVSAAAQLAGVHRKTVERWRNEVIDSLPELGTIEAELKKQHLFRRALAAMRTVTTLQDRAGTHALSPTETSQHSQALVLLDSVKSEIARLTGGQGIALPKASPRSLIVQRLRQPKGRSSSATPRLNEGLRPAPSVHSTEGRGP